MTIQALKRKKQELLASQVSRIASDTNENLLRVNLSKFFTDLEHEIQSALLEYWNDHMLLQGQVNLILASIHEKHQEYYELIMKHKLQEFHRAEKLGERLVKRQEQSAMKASKPVRFTANKDNLFGTLQYSEDRLAEHTFTASENTLNRVDSNINEILLDGYKSGVGINEVSRQITERFDQLRTWEAKRIARTEIHTAQNMGVMNSYDQLGVEYTQWISASDARVRDSHVEIDREIIPMGGTYSNGLRFPGDTSGPIEEWINCRCSNAPFVLPAGMMAPSFSPFREEDLIPIETMETPKMIEAEAPINDNFIYVKGLESFETFVETIEAENRKLYQQCKRHECFEEVYNILKESQVDDFTLKEVQVIDIAQMKKEQLKEYIQELDVELFDRIDGYDISWKKFCEAFDLMYEFSSGRKIIDDEKVLDAVCEAINNQEGSLCYALETKSKNKKGGQSLMLAIDF